MKVWSGTSGFAYKEWRGSFYPDNAKPDDFLRHYAGALEAVEINSTFYRMPRASVLEGWAAMVPDQFRFVLKASRRITHQSRLEDAGDSVAYLWKQAEVLGQRLGPVLFQLPPNLRANHERLAAFTRALPQGMRAAFEFRHDSWHDPRTHEILGAGNHALCTADTDEDDGLLVPTASWGYARLRRESYSPTELAAWLTRFRDAGFAEVFCFFKHEDGAIGPEAARQIREIAAAEG
ncbi:MAG: DUF72 domain-containing protein [Deltaproteobacteria bacterium]|nr:DUF72 domain-containing protein [Deltaproteobacteria bacterium]